MLSMKKLNVTTVPLSDLNGMIEQMIKKMATECGHYICDR